MSSRRVEEERVYDSIMTQDTHVDAIVVEAEKDMTKSFNSVLGATIAVCIVFLFISASYDRYCFVV